MRAVVGGAEQAAEGPALNFANGYLDVPIQNPNSSLLHGQRRQRRRPGRRREATRSSSSGTRPTPRTTRSPASPTRSTSTRYKLDGTRLWRINLGRNIRAGAHYTQFQVYDYDGDGDAEVAMKTADGTVDGAGRVIGDANADYRNSSGYILSGPEYLTMFDGRTGAALSTVNYEPPRGTVSSWGDAYGNRVDRFLAGTAYLDGSRPSLIMARGYYTRTVLVAWDFRNGTLTRRWTFDSNASGNSAYAGQGNHQLSIADVDEDGRDEIIYGAMAIDDNGGRLWNTGHGHGDAMHVGDLDPVPAGPGGVQGRRGHQQAGRLDGRRAYRIRSSGPTRPAVATTAAASRTTSTPAAPARSPGRPACPACSTRPGRTSAANRPAPTSPSGGTATPSRELLDATHIDKYGTSSDTRLLTASDVHSNNGTKSTPSLSGDLLGDWREEVIWPTTDEQRAAHLHHADADRPPDRHPDARPPVPRGDRLAEHGVQPAAAPELRDPVAPSPAAPAVPPRERSGLPHPTAPG